MTSNLLSLHEASRKLSLLGAKPVTKTIRVTFKDGRPNEEHVIAGFRDSGMGCRVLAADGRDLGYFGPEVCQSIILEIRFDELPDKVTEVGLDESCSRFLVEA